MKKLNFYLTFLFIASFALIINSCKKDEKTVEQGINTDEAATVIANSISSSGTGATVTSSLEMFDSIEAKSGLKSGYCSFTADTSGTINFSDTVNDITLNYTFDYTVGVHCNGQIPDYFYFDFVNTADYDAPYYAASADLSGHYELSGLMPANENYVFSGNATYTGIQTFKQTGDEIEATVDLTYQNINFNQTTHVLVSGTLIVHLTGTTFDDKTFDYTGTITYDSDMSTATLTIEGNVYQIDTQSGEVTSK